MPETGDISALAVAVRQRRAKLGLTHEDVVNRGGPSGVTLTKIEAAKGPVPRGATLKKLDLALDWRPGSALRTLSGDKPTPIDDEPRAGSSLLPPPPQDLADEALQMAAHLVEAVEKLNDELPRLSDRAESAVVAILSVAMRLSDKGYDVRSGEMIDLTGLASDPQGFLDAAAKNEGLLELRRMRAAKADQLLRRMFDAVHVGATRNALAHGRPVPPPPPALPAYSIDDDAAKAVTSLADRRKVPPPPSLDGLDVAASRREKESDRYPNLAWWVPPSEVAHPQATPGAVPDSIRAVVPKKVFREYAASVEGVRKHLKAVEDAAAEQRLTTATVTSLLNAIAAHATAARDFMSELRRVELDATPEQIDGALPLFEQAERFAASLSRFVGHLLPAAPNTDESDRLIATQRSLAELENFHRHAYDVWVETGRSSKSLKAIASRREEQSDGDRDDEDGK